jgi:hypothetical protein
MMSARRKRWLTWAFAVLALTTVFALYLNPQVAVTLANQIWNCF